MTEREKEIKHFAHEHLLIFNESEEIPFCCNACGLRVLSSPSYICTVQGCSFYLHEPCTRLPNKLSHRFGNNTHDLLLYAKPLHEDCMCIKCGKLCKNFTYHCGERGKYFNLDPLCGYPLDIQIKHISHKQHPMVAICKESLLLCDACGNEHKGFFFACHQCNYWTHQDCTSLPNILRVGGHRHLLSIVYSDALEALYSSMPECIICEKDTSRLLKAYACVRCSMTIAHVDCAVSAMEDPGKIYDLPPLDDAFLSWIKCAVQNTTPKSDGVTMLENYHSAPAHSLTSNNETTLESVCNACIRRIEPPYYSCSQSACGFLLHKICTDLPLVVDDVFGDSRDLVFPRCDEFFSLFFCRLCLRLGNGFGYSYSYSGIFHLECALAPEVIKHDSHKQHPLILGFGYWLENIRSCCDKINPLYYDIYSCTQCRFSIHIGCALLPKTVSHKFDEHPLTLITDSSAQDLGGDLFCEFCEEDIKLSYWFYHCMECDHSFHVECIPSTGRYSRIKFGGTVVLPACHGDHPLTLVRMLSVGSQTCGVCQEMIEGFKDGMALHCDECDFWVHFICGSKSSDATVSKPYQVISDFQYFLNRFA
ncbi:uncharacterized protein [Primulina eburnea]|uniref:uncharacterized protein isoform X1 n=1 Tax=Primulina eburnea TaxID=1245227 RepID=UPI003C6CC30F